MSKIYKFVIHSYKKIDVSPISPGGFSKELIILFTRASYHINKYFQLEAGVENILDQRYRVFASGISGAGRNFILTLRGNY